MSKKNEKKDIHSKDRDNVIPFPKPSSPRSSSSEEDVGSGRDTQSISNQIGTDGETIQKIARLEGWKRKERNALRWMGWILGTLPNNRRAK